ncbi:MAG: TonB-dependent receptor [Alphaproteobacteria bacterium]|nr:TonB-dependent receptor [Alphaproteobacteria bacterium]MBU6471327.1 TonB-dependent receptor [Alphaproteobacteria bacterium]MDE2494636.1 TonB-dependent receptor [Alphaproteobacteria bacterium]
MRKFLLICPLVLSCGSSPAWAEEAAALPETVVVTATRSPEPLDLTGVSVSVISGGELQRQQILVLSDALAETPGVEVNRDGGVGETTSLGLRGSADGQTLVLIDGVRISDPSAPNGQAVLGDLMVNNVSRVEILRGPQSTLYGSDAIGGVVNILTRRGGDTPFAANLDGEGGSYGTYRVNAAANGTVDRIDYEIAANYFDTTGISAADSRNGNTEPDGDRNFGLTGNTRFHVSNTVSIDLRAYYDDARTQFDGYPPPTYTLRDDGEYDTDKLFAGYAGVNLALFDGRFRNRVAFMGSSSDRKDFNDPNILPLIEDFFGRGGAARFEYQGVFQVNEVNIATFGAETENTTLATHSGYDSTAQITQGHVHTSGYYGQWQTTLFQQLTLTGGARYEDNSEFGGHASFKLAAAEQLFGGDTTLRANYGDGFKAPSLYELFSQYSNPLGPLRPETAKGWEAGMDQALLDGHMRASLTYFDRHTHNQIDFFSCDGVTSAACALRLAQGGYYYNIGRSHASGVEAALAGQLADTLSVTANYTYLSAVDGLTGTDLARLPRDAANAILTWTPSQIWSVGARFSFVGSRFDDAGQSVPLDSFTGLDMFGSFRLNDAFALFARVENLLDAHEEPVHGYGRLGRAVYAGVRTEL